MKKGDLVCELDSASLRDQLTNQKIATQGAEASFQNAKLTREVAEIAVKEYVEGIYLQDKATIQGEIKLAESDLARAADRVDWATRMFEKGYVSKAQKVSEELNFQKAKFTLEQAQSKLNVLENYTKAKTIKELESEVEKALSDELAKKQTYQLEKDKEAKLEKQIVNCKLFAPGDGIVVYANDPMRSFGSNPPQIEEGATVRERQKIFSLPDIAKMQVNAKVHESQIDKITPEHEGPDPGRRLRRPASSPAPCSDVAPLPDPTSFFSSDIKVYTTHIRIDNPLPGLRPGMNAEVEILVDRKENVLRCRSRRSSSTRARTTSPRSPNGFERTRWPLGVNNEKFVEVTKGLTAGDVVALNPISLMTDEEKREPFGVAGKERPRRTGAGRRARARPDQGGVPGQGRRRRGKGGDLAKAKAKGKGRGGAGGGDASRSSRTSPRRSGEAEDRQPRRRRPRSSRRPASPTQRSSR